MFIYKKCTGCKTFKTSDKFSKSKKGKYGLHNHCKVCAKILKDKWYQENRESQIAYSITYAKSPKGIKERKLRYIKNKDQLLAKNRQYRANDNARQKANTARRKKYYSDPSFRISVSQRTRIIKALKGISKSKHTIDLLGCSIDQLKLYLENKFLPGMSWDNYGYRGWHVDHIIPCASFDLSCPEQQAKCFHYTNLQPLWWKDNISKHSRLGSINSISAV